MIYDPMPPTCTTKGCGNLRSPMQPLCYWCALERMPPPEPVTPGGPPLCVECDAPRLEGKPVCERHDRASEVARQIGELERRAGSAAGPELDRLRSQYYALTGTRYIEHWRMHPERDP